MASIGERDPLPDRSESGMSRQSDERETPLAVEGLEREERYGPIALTRHVKRDGRALILYTRVEPRGDRGVPRGDTEQGIGRR